MKSAAAAAAATTTTTTTMMDDYNLFNEHLLMCWFNSTNDYYKASTKTQTRQKQYKYTKH
jgi:hypothetical protein